MKEIDIKKVLVRHLLDKEPNAVLGAEVPFKYGSRRADIIAIQSDLSATAYEIKGAGDSAERLAYQVESYKEYFDFCYIVCEVDNLSQIRKNIGKEIGIMLVSESSISQIRKSKQFKRHDKESLASTVSTKMLKAVTGNRELRSKHDLGMELVSNKTLDFIRQLSRKELTQKYGIVTSLLRKETSKVINSDDIQTITRMPPNNLFLRS